MLRHRAVLVSAIAAGFLPAIAAHASDATPLPQPEIVSTPQQQVQPASPRPLASSEIQVESRSTSLRFATRAAPPAASHSDGYRPGPALGAASSSSYPYDFRYGPSSSGVTQPPLDLYPVVSAAKPGWQFSGRVGPLRWLSPLDGEGDTQLRLGGRVPGQPRMQGMGLFNIGVHYTFE